MRENTDRISPWCLVYEGIDPGREGLRETLCTLGNGYVATRGAVPESRADGIHYPGTYGAGCYNRLRDKMAGQVIETESLVNLPNWLTLTFRIDDGPWWNLTDVEVLDHQRELDLRRGLLLRRLRFRDSAGRTTQLSQRRFVHMELPHLAGLETTIIPENWTGVLTIRSSVDGDVTNTGVARYRDLDGRHLTGHAADAPAPDIIRLRIRTRQSGIHIATAARTRLWRNTDHIDPPRRFLGEVTTAAQDITVHLAAGDQLHIEKIVAIITSRDRAISEPGLEAVSWLVHAGRFTDLLTRHVLVWNHLWQRFRVDFTGEERLLGTVRLHLFHLLQTVSPHSADLDAGVPARGLSGEAYRGHVLWDELFVLPLLTLRLPTLTRALLLYRHRRLTEARWAARAAGHTGAMYPWQSGSNGREESQCLHLNPHSGRWISDDTHLRHIGIAVAYNVWHYYQVTGDQDFLAHHGAEMILEIARFFADLASHDPAHDRHVIRGVVGPDEFHTAYPDAPTPGVDNNAYTNIMAAWLLTRALETLDALPAQRRHELIESLGLRAPELERWKVISRTMFVPFHSDGVIISQFEGYEQLTELDWDDYRARYADLQRLDRILEAEGDSPNRYQVSKQADVLMLFYLLSADELGALFDQLGYHLDREAIPRNIDYYLARTTHGSTLSAVVHGWVLARANRDRAVEFLHAALDSDIADIQGGTTAEGIHLAAMAGSVDLLLRCFTGVEPRGDTLWLNPAGQLHWAHSNSPSTTGIDHSRYGSPAPPWPCAPAAGPLPSKSAAADRSAPSAPTRPPSSPSPDPYLCSSADVTG